jgi:type IV secretory pathway VirJ component
MILPLLIVATATLDYGRLGTVTLYEPAGPPKELVLFVSGDGGWISGVVEMAGHFAEHGALVAGIDVNRWGEALRASSDGCTFTAGELQQLAHDLERRYRFATYVNPILVGYSSGATLAYTTLVQSPPGTLQVALSLRFSPDRALEKAMCPGDGPGLASDPGPKRKGHVFRPAPALKDPWIALHGDEDQVCSFATTRDFIARVPSATLVELPKVGHGFSVERNYVPQMLAAFDRLAATAPRLPPAARDISDLPLVEVAPSGPPRDLVAVMLSGDGGWAGLDREVAAVLAKRGVRVVGWDSLRYFWTARTPAIAAADLARIVRHYTEGNLRTRVVAVGYSLGADTMPFMVNRLPADARSRVALTALIAPGREAFFEFHVALWLGKTGGGLPLAPELAKLKGAGLLCIYGADESDSACAGLPASGYALARLPGGHHFDGDYARIAERILEATP